MMRAQMLEKPKFITEAEFQSMIANVEAQIPVRSEYAICAHTAVETRVPQEPVTQEPVTQLEQERTTELLNQLHTIHSSEEIERILKEIEVLQHRKFTQLVIPTTANKIQESCEASCKARQKDILDKKEEELRARQSPNALRSQFAVRSEYANCADRTRDPCETPNALRQNTLREREAGVISTIWNTNRTYAPGSFAPVEILLDVCKDFDKNFFHQFTPFISRKQKPGAWLLIEIQGKRANIYTTAATPPMFCVESFIKGFNKNKGFDYMFRCAVLGRLQMMGYIKSFSPFV